MEEQEARKALEGGAKYPYDTPDAWYAVDKREEPPPAQDWAHVAARGVLHDLEHRGGIGNSLDDVDEEIREEIVQSAAAIIRLAYKEGAAQ